MARSLFLAKFLGIYLIVMFILFAARKKAMMDGVKAILDNPAAFMVTGLFNLLGGLALLIGHPVLQANWRILITLLAILMIIKGVLRLGYPAYSIQWANAILENKKTWGWLMGLTLIIGIILTIYGYSH